MPMLVIAPIDVCEENHVHNVEELIACWRRGESWMDVLKGENPWKTAFEEDFSASGFISFVVDEEGDEKVEAARSLVRYMARAMVFLEKAVSELQMAETWGEKEDKFCSKAAATLENIGDIIMKNGGSDLFIALKTERNRMRITFDS